MKRSRYTEQIIGILKEQAGTPVAELCPKHATSDATFSSGRANMVGSRSARRSGCELWRRKTPN